MRDRATKQGLPFNQGVAGSSPARPTTANIDVSRGGDKFLNYVIDFLTRF